MRGPLKPAGAAFDTNLLLRPTSRKLAACWMESAGRSTMILPEVARELMLSEADAWRRTLTNPRSVYRMVHMDARAKETVAALLESFTLPCFPRLSDREEIPSNADAIILSQGLAMGMDIILTNNMKSIDHHQVNALLMDEWGRNAPFVSSLDDAFCAAHTDRNGGERMLRLLLSSDWPLDGSDMTLSECCERFDKLTERMAKGMRMPNAAARAANAFETSGRLLEIVQAAQHDAKAFRALREEAERKGERAASVAGAPKNAP